MNPLRLLAIADAVASLSKDPSTKVGAIALDEDCNILSVGFNGFPRGVIDSLERYEDRPTKYKFIAHAELNVVAQAARNGIKLIGATLVVTQLYPCNTCAQAIIQAGFKRVLAPMSNSNDRWTEATEVARTMFQEAGVVVEYYETKRDETQLWFPLYEGMSGNYWCNVDGGTSMVTVVESPTPSYDTGQITGLHVDPPFLTRLYNPLPLMEDSRMLFQQVKNPTPPPRR